MMLHRTLLFHDLNQLLMKLKESEVHHIFLIKQFTRKPFGTKLLNFERSDLDILLTFHACLQNMFLLTCRTGRTSAACAGSCRTGRASAARTGSCRGRSLISIYFTRKYMFHKFESYLMMSNL